MKDKKIIKEKNKDEVKIDNIKRKPLATSIMYKNINKKSTL